MKIVFSDHAKKQRIARKIPKSYVLQTVKNPQQKLPSFRNSQLSQKQFGGKILEVVTTTDGESIIVVTQYYLEKE